MKIEISNLPENPGCYLFKNKEGEIIYIGKAKNLKKRVSSYFQKKDLDIKTRSMLSHAESLDFIATNSEVESLILENNLIKKYSPKYNILLKDSKSYAYIHVTDEEFPRIVVTRNKSEKGTLFGPFTSGKKRDELVYTLNKMFNLRTCIKLPKKACLKYSIGLCSGPCINQISKMEYLDSIYSAKLVLSGKIRELELSLEGKMKFASAKNEFEKAIKYREQIRALQILRERQNMERKVSYDEDIFYYEIKENVIYILVFNINKGILENKQEFVFDSGENSFEEFLIQFYSENPIPKEIITQEELEDSIKEYLEIQRKSKISFVVPVKGDKKILLDLVKENIRITFFSNSSNLEDLKKELDLQELPSVIECFDISHLSGTKTVASMVQFRNGVPDKSNYRRYKLSIEGNDDFASISEVVKRRYTKLVSENSPLPNLILIDGGLGQLHYAMKSLEELNLKIPIISLAKEFEEIYLPGKEQPIQLGEKNKARLFLQQIRDEAHRFAISYNRLLRKKSLFK